MSPRARLSVACIAHATFVYIRVYTPVMAKAYWRVYRDGKWTFVPQMVYEDGEWRQQDPDCACYYCTKGTIVMSLVPKDDDSNSTA